MIKYFALLLCLKFKSCSTTTIETSVLYSLCGTFLQQHIVGFKNNSSHTQNQSLAHYILTPVLGIVLFDMHLRTIVYWPFEVVNSVVPAVSASFLGTGPG